MKAVVPPCAFLHLHVTRPLLLNHRLTTKKTSCLVLYLVITPAGEQTTADLQSPLK